MLLLIKVFFFKKISLFLAPHTGLPGHQERNEKYRTRLPAKANEIK